ncbi:MAG: phage portal protein [Alphaproteobacteria bacterium]|nr:phage portal protein [Alphaproteobacteria bacterium]
MSEDQEFIIGAKIDNPSSTLDQFKSDDPFNGSWDVIKSYSGLENNFKRRTNRIVEKALSPENTQGYLDSARAEQHGIDGAKSKEINPGVVYRNAYGLFDVITPPWNVYELANYYDTSFANHAAIDAKVENIVGLGYDFEISPSTMLRLESNQDKDQVSRARNRIERAKIEMHAWLESLNDDDSFTTTMTKVYTDMQAIGNGYLEIGRTTTGQIGYVGHIPATTIRVRRVRDGYVQIIGQKVVYFRNFGATNPNPITADPRPNEIIHFKQYSPLNTFYGVPDILSAINSLHGDQLASQYNIDYFSNKAVPRYVVTLKGARLSADAEDKMFRFLQTNLKGQSHRTLYIPLPGDTDTNKVDFKMEPIENGVQEGSFERYRQQNRDDILIAHQVPLSKIGGADAGGVAAALSQDRTFKEQVARPAQRELEKILNKIIKEQTDILVLKFKELTLTDEIAQSQILERYVKTQVMLPNEARTALGLPQREGGDEPFQPKPQDTANDTANRARDGERLNNQSDGSATLAGRNPKGEGRSTQ